MTPKRCRCTADMRLVNGELRCPHNCPPKAPKPVKRAVPERQREPRRAKQSVTS